MGLKYITIDVARSGGIVEAMDYILDHSQEIEEVTLRVWDGEDSPEEDPETQKSARRIKE